MSTVDSRPLRQWLKARREANELLLDLMGQRYDLDGAAEAGQLGLAWRAQEDMLVTGAQLYLSVAGVEVAVRAGGDRLGRSFAVLDALGRVNRDLSDRAWQLLLRPVPPQQELPTEVDRTVQFLADDLGLRWIRSRRQTVLQWASDTRALRTVAKRAAVAQSDDWYVSEDPGLPAADWYQEVLDSLEQELNGLELAEEA